MQQPSSAQNVLDSKVLFCRKVLTLDSDATETLEAAAFCRKKVDTVISNILNRKNAGFHVLASLTFQRYRCWLCTKTPH
jgi:hypothetical protein